MRLEDGAAALYFLTPCLGRPRWLRRAARARGFGGLAQKADEALARILAVPRLAAESLGGDDNDAGAGEARPREMLEPGTNLWGEGRGVARVKAQLDRG